MKKITLSLFAAACSLSSAFSQVVLQENFTDPFVPASAGWGVQNNSVPGNTVSWAQGNQTGSNAFLTAYNGSSTDDFFMADFFCVPNSLAGDISAFLITPTVTIYNGAVLEFATSTMNFTNVANVYPDRMQVLMSTSGTSSAVPTGTASVGPFTNTLLDINPLLTTNYATAVSGGSVNGYPSSWTVYSLQITGVTGTVTGRFAFRYFVANGGGGGANSRAVGVDAVKYTLPCGPTVQSFTTCVGANTTLNAIGGLPATTYSWSTGGTGSSIVVSPSATQVYTLYPGVNGGLCPTAVEATVTVGPSLVVSVSSSSTTICSGNTVTLTATSSASSYIWSNSLTVSSFTAAPNVTTTYSVLGISGTCTGTNAITVNVNASPNMSVNLSPACLGGSITITASGANTYTYLGSSTNPQTIASPTVAGPYFFNLFGANANGCTQAGQINFSVSPNPTVVVSSSLVACVNSTVSLTASGASTYSWSGAGTGTTNPLSSPTGSTAVVRTYTVVGTATTGCSSAPAVRTITISACTGIENIFGNNVETSVFPNPFTNELQVSGLDGYVKVYNALGQLVFSTKVYDTTTINTSEYSKGVYVLKAYTNQGTELKTTKLIKN